MSDLIDRQSVLKAIDEYERLSMVSQTVRNMTSLREIVQWLPAVQTCDDAVSRADVIELVKDSYYNLAESMEDTWTMVVDVENLPAVQPQQIVRCKDCKHWKDSDGVYRRGVDAESKCPLNIQEVYAGTFYCGYAERRTDE